MKVLIAGAGLGGLTAAACLMQRGHRVRVYEQAPELGEIGAGIQLSANSVKVLDTLGLRERLDAVAVRPPETSTFFCGFGALLEGEAGGGEVKTW
jgi:salicylate hydroxylase